MLSRRRRTYGKLAASQGRIESCPRLFVCLFVCLSKTIRHSGAKLSGFGFMGQLLRSKAPKSSPIGGVRSFVDPLAKVAHWHLWFSTSIWISNWRCKFRIFLILEDGSTQNLLECVPISLKSHRECLPAPLPCTAGSSNPFAKTPERKFRVNQIRNGWTAEDSGSKREGLKVLWRIHRSKLWDHYDPKYGSE